ncbi:MAG: DUF4145 domain-containing protein [Parvularculaceae bacterium]
MEKRSRLSLHARIDKYKQTDSNSAEYLLAIKWLGNEGSHASLDKVGERDLLDGFDTFDHLIERIYVKREAIKEDCKGHQL